jgi:taurine dioxygenase
VQTVRELVHEHLVVFFPDQQLSVRGHHALGRAIGELVPNSYTPAADPAHPGVTEHRSEDGYVADVWHSDGQPRPAPTSYTIFKMVTAPSRGGDTIWANQQRAYEILSAPMRAMLDGLTAVHRSLVNPDVQSTHPAVMAHPVTGRRFLYVSKAHTTRFLELTAGESTALVDYLCDLATQQENICRYRWSPGAVGVWDNLATVHYGVNDFAEPRVFHRVMVQGPELPERVTAWPDCADGRPRTMVRADGTSAVVGQVAEPLWPADRAN